MKELIKVLLPIIAVSCLLTGHVAVAIWAAMFTVIWYVLPGLTGLVKK